MIAAAPAVVSSSSSSSRSATTAGAADAATTDMPQGRRRRILPWQRRPRGRRRPGRSPSSDAFPSSAATFSASCSQGRARQRRSILSRVRRIQQFRGRWLSSSQQAGWATATTTGMDGREQIKRNPTGNVRVKRTGVLGTGTGQRMKTSAAVRSASILFSDLHNCGAFTVSGKIYACKSITHCGAGRIKSTRRHGGFVCGGRIESLALRRFRFEQSTQRGRVGE
jgi:hypothetical protein